MLYEVITRSILERGFHQDETQVFPPTKKAFPTPPIFLDLQTNPWTGHPGPAWKVLPWHFSANQGWYQLPQDHQEVWYRITSYNVCYTKLLRHIEINNLDKDARQYFLDKVIKEKPTSGTFDMKKLLSYNFV